MNFASHPFNNAFLYKKRDEKIQFSDFWRESVTEKYDLTRDAFSKKIRKMLKRRHGFYLKKRCSKNVTQNREKF